MYKNVQGYTINGNKNESENEKYITSIRLKET